MPKHVRWLGVFVIVAVGMAALVVARSIEPFRRPRATLAPVTEAQPTPQLSESNPPIATNPEKPNYEGPLGDFMVGVRQPSSFPPCPAPRRKAKNDRIKASELYSSAFGDNLEGLVVECGDGKIIAIELYGEEVVGRGYFVGKPRVPYESPLDRLKLLTVAGKPAIMQLPPPDIPGLISLAVIERFPEGNKPGIFVWIDDTMKSLEDAAELIAQIMGREGKQ